MLTYLLDVYRFERYQMLALHCGEDEQALKKKCVARMAAELGLDLEGNELEPADPYTTPVSESGSSK